jgi:hypothetical protein
MMNEFFSAISRALSPYFTEMSIMLMATILVVYGDIINRYIKRILAPYHFIIRVSLFVLLCAFGYGALTLYGAPFLRHIIAFLPWHYQGAGFIVSFLLIGFLAERRRYI